MRWRKGSFNHCFCSWNNLEANLARLDFRPFCGLNRATVRILGKYRKEDEEDDKTMDTTVAEEKDTTIDIDEADTVATDEDSISNADQNNPSKPSTQ